MSKSHFTSSPPRRIFMMNNNTTGPAVEDVESLEFSMFKIITAVSLALVTNIIMSLFHLLQNQTENNQYRLHNLLYTHLAVIIQVGSSLSLLYILLDSLRLVDEEPLDSLVTIINFVKLRVLSLSLATICAADLLERLDPAKYLGK